MNHLGHVLGKILKHLGERRFGRTALPMHCPALPSTVNRDPFKWIPVKLFFPTSTLDELRVAKLSFAPISFWFFAATCRWKKSLLWETSRNEMEWEEDEGVRELFVLHRFQQIQFSHKNGNKSSVNWRSNENLGAVPFWAGASLALAARTGSTRAAAAASVPFIFLWLARQRRRRRRRRRRSTLPQW